MNYQHTVTGIFLERPNRFLAHVSIDGTLVVCHVKNTGRCRELLIPGVQVILQFHPDAHTLGRKTEYSLIGVYKDLGGKQTLINMDSQAPNEAAFEWILSGHSIFGSQCSNLKREVTFGNSRFDLAFEHNGISCYMEVKGVTLEMDGTAMFPDAPTERGIKHLLELQSAASQGLGAYLLFVIQMKGIVKFTPNMATHAAFGLTLRDCCQSGVKILAYDCLVEKDRLVIDQAVPVVLPE